MEQLDREMQRRVWERVQSREPVQMPRLPREGIRHLMYPALENSAAYRSLSRRLPGKNGETLGRLHRESRKGIACMKGICRLRGEPVKPLGLTVPTEPPRRMLEKCYHREKQLHGAFEARTADPEHGAAFRRLAQQARERCMILLEILGELEK